MGSDYFNDHTAINLPRDLKCHNCFVYSYFLGKNIWPIEDGVAVQGTLRVNNTMFMMEAIKRGQGIGFIPDFVCREALEKGEIIEVLGNSKKPNLTLYALYPARHFVPTNRDQTAKAFLDKRRIFEKTMQLFHQSEHQ